VGCAAREGFGEGDSESLINRLQQIRFKTGFASSANHRKQKNGWQKNGGQSARGLHFSARHFSAVAFVFPAFTNVS
jgi:hypothetical protein